MDFNRLSCTALLVVAASTFPFLATATVQITPKCESGPRDMEYIYEHGAITLCFYANLSLTQAYQAHRKTRSDSNNLASTLIPGKDLKIENLGDTEMVEYVWKGNNDLHITQNYPGGITEFMFVADKTGTNVTEIAHPD